MAPALAIVRSCRFNAIALHVVFACGHAAQFALVAQTTEPRDTVRQATVMGGMREATFQEGSPVINTLPINNVYEDNLLHRS